jgi:hypothetical protein
LHPLDKIRHNGAEKTALASGATPAGKRRFA